ncbi:MAG: hypothetical protein AAF726_12170 [Planctomycetota bacterium]
MSRSETTTHLRTLAGAALLTVFTTACAQTGARPVLSVDANVVDVEIAAARTVDGPVGPLADGRSDAPEAVSEAVDDLSLDVLLGEARDAQQRALRPKRGIDRVIGDEAPQQLDPEQGPVDLGLKLMVNFGSREAPYDDAMPPIEGMVVGRPGFSDSVLQVTWRERVGENYGFHGTAALTRFQDLAIVEGIADAEFAWFVLGVHASF